MVATAFEDFGKGFDVKKQESDTMLVWVTVKKKTIQNITIENRICEICDWRAFPYVQKTLIRHHRYSLKKSSTVVYDSSA